MGPASAIERGRASGGQLDARGVSVRFEGILALDNVDLTLRPDEILGLIGPNGAGKTTLINVITGFQAPDHGSITLDDEDITGLSPFRIGRRGLARTFQAVRLFRDLTVLENAELAGVGMGLSRASARERAWETLDLLGLADMAMQRGLELPYGDERRVGIARALATRPKYLLLDEPAAGMNEKEAAELGATVRTILQKFCCGILVIEHNMTLIMELCDRIQVLEHGRAIALGTPSEIARDRAVRRAYLGAEGDLKDAALAREQNVPAGKPPLLAVENLAVSYGAVAALRGVSLRVDEGELVSVVGPNGAGKSTLMHAISGIVRPDAGEITFAGQPIARLAVETRVRKGIALVPEGRGVFPALTVAENLLIGAVTRLGNQAAVRAATERVLEFFPILRERNAQPAGRLSGGEQQQLAIARALLSEPRILLLDEPSLGLAVRIVDEVYEILKRLNRGGVSVLVVEQSVMRAFAAAQRTYVLRNGLVELEGHPQDLVSSERFDAAYFGFVQQPGARQ
jgi:ABC-type branched-subunit amino acid transport system ATPase component